MGFVPKKKTYVLDFAGTAEDGLLVTVRGLSTGEYLDAIELERTSNEDEESADKLILLFADKLVSWNIEDEAGTPVPADLGGVRQQDLDFNLTIINAWTTAMAGVPAPLEQSSPAGEPSPVESIPMETLSSSLAS